MPDNLNAGHRKRLKQSFIENPSSLYDYEILEAILFSSNPRKDTKKIAKVLLNNFGTLNKVLNASSEELKCIDNVTDSVIFSIKLTREVATRILKKDIENRKLLDSIENICNYCHSKIGHLKKEQIRAIYLSKSFRLIKDELLNEGNMMESTLYKNEVISKATFHASPHIILYHNHPSGTFKPSLADKIVTQDLKEVLLSVNLSLIDHIIVSEYGSYSMKEGGFFNCKI